jgi:molybdate transport system substrate-binding protein
LSILLIFTPSAVRCEVVAVAGGLFPCVSELADLYKTKNGDAPDLVVGSSGKLASQIAAGAPFGLLISANREWLQFLEDRDLVAEIVPLASSPLVLWWPREKEPGLELLYENIRVAMVDPELGPFGSTARHYLENIGVYGEMWRDNRLIFTSSALQSALAAQSGAADLAFTSVAVATKIKKEFRVAGSAVVIPEYDLIHAGALITGQGNALIQDFWKYLRSEETEGVWIRWGFTLQPREP